jgi:hypothetical protein
MRRVASALTPHRRSAIGGPRVAPIVKLAVNAFLHVLLSPHHGRSPSHCHSAASSSHRNVFISISGSSCQPRVRRCRPNGRCKASRKNALLAGLKGNRMRSPAGTHAGTAVSVERSADRVHLSPAPRQQCCERTQAGPRRGAAQWFATRNGARSKSRSVARHHAAHALIAVTSGSGTSWTRRGDCFTGLSSAALSSASAAAALRSNSLS